MEDRNKNYTGSVVARVNKNRAVSRTWTRGFSGKLATEFQGSRIDVMKLGKKTIPIRLAQWNVLGLNKTGKLSIVTKELEDHEVLICGMSETKWKSSGHFTSEGSTIVFSGGNSNREHHGVAIWVNRRISSTLMEYNPVSSRIIVATFRAKPRDMTIVQCYAPTRDHEADIGIFYEELTAVINSIRKRNVLVVMGDFNARVGANASEVTVLGEYGYGDRDDSGQRLIEFCSEHKLVLANTFFKRHPRRLYTWKQAGDISRAQLDYIAISREWRYGVDNAKTYPGADGDTDHNLLVMSLRLRLNCRKKECRPIIDVGLLEDVKLQEKFQVSVCNRFAALEGLSVERDPNAKWSNIKNALEDAAREILSCQEKKKKQWISDETWELIKEKRAVKNKDEEQYKVLNKEVQRKLRKDRQDDIDRLCEDLERNERIGNSRTVFSIVRKFTQKFQPRQVAIKSKDGIKLTDPEKVGERWREYCEELFDDVEGEVSINVTEREPPPTMAEVNRAVKRMSHFKAPGADNIPVEFFRYGGDAAMNGLYEICRDVWESGVWPEEWTNSVFVPLPKKGDPLQCSNYRTIALVSHASKILLRVILERMQCKLESEIAEEQAGFRAKRGTRDQITNLRIIVEKSKEYSQPLYMCFVDFQKAFDMVKHGDMWMTMLEMGFPPHLIQILRNLYKQQSAIVKVAGIKTRCFRVKKGVRQGCILSPCLFNILAEAVMRKVLDGYKKGFRLGGYLINNLRYADDIVLIATTPEDLQELVSRLVKEAADSNMLLNASKTKVMTTNGEKITIAANGQVLEQVTSFKYLGADITEEADCSVEIKQRLGMAANVQGRLKMALKNKGVSKKTRWRLVQALVRPVATYGCESWTLRKVEEKRIMAFENKCARRTLQIPWTAKMTNEEVWAKLEEKPTLLQHVKERKLCFFGHIVRQEKNSLENACMTGLTSGSRGRGRPPICWFDNVLKWSGLSGSLLLKNAKDREQWRATVHRCGVRSCND